jgi:hypothetical protein
VSGPITEARGPAYNLLVYFGSYAASTAVWRGAELFDRPDWSATLTEGELRDLEAFARASAGPDESGAPVSDRTAPPPSVSARALAARTALETGSGAVLLRGLPFARWGESLSTRVFWALAGHIGTPVSQSAEGERVFHVRDQGYADQDPRFRGPASRKRLSFHTDRCDVIAFACLQSARAGGDNFIVSSVALYEELRTHQPQVLRVLCEPFPYLRHTVDRGNTLPFCLLPVFSEQDGHFAAHFLRVLIDRADREPSAPTLTAAQRDALDALEALAEDPALHVRVRLEPGDVLLLNNWTTLHRRSAFTDAASLQERRHLLRIWLSMADSRPIAPCFAEHFGATAAGALRGGMRPARRPA